MPKLSDFFNETEASYDATLRWLHSAVSRTRGIDFHDFFQIHQIPVNGHPETEFLNSLSGSGVQDGEWFGKYLEEAVDFVLFNVISDDVIYDFNKLVHLSFLNWQASPHKPYKLMKRVLPEVQENYVELTGKVNEDCSTFLKEAWVAAYSADPDPEKAYNASRQAVENLLRPIVSPKNTRSTISTMRRDIKSGMERGKWVCTIPADSNDSAVTKFLQLLEMMPYEERRHGATAKLVTIEGARTQVQLALTICQLLVDEAFKGVA